MRFKVYILAGSMRQDLGFTRLIDDKRPDALAYYQNRSYHCAKCGQIWMEWVKEEQPGQWPTEWYPSRRTCGEHDHGAWHSDTPGSSLLYRTDIVVVPRAILEHELLLLTEPK